MIYQHILVIRSEHDDYEGDVERLARDAVHGDARLSAWNKEPFPEHLLTDDERDFFGFETLDDDDSPELNMEQRTKEAADRVADALRKYLPPIGSDERHEILGDFSLVRNWAQSGARSYDDKGGNG